MPLEVSFVFSTLSAVLKNFYFFLLETPFFSSLTVVTLFLFSTHLFLSHILNIPKLPFGKACVFSYLLNLSAFFKPVLLSFSSLMRFSSVLWALAVRQLFNLSLLSWPPLGFGFCLFIASQVGLWVSPASSDKSEAIFIRLNFYQ